MFSLFRNTAKKLRFDSGKDLARCNHHQEYESEVFMTFTNTQRQREKSQPPVHSDFSNDNYATSLLREKKPVKGKICQDKVYQNTVKSDVRAEPGSRNKDNRII